MITNSAQFNNQAVNQQLLRPTMASPIPAMESSIDAVALVSSDEAISNYPVAGGATVALIDLGRRLLVLKTNDVYSGRGMYYETYALTKKETAPPVQNGPVNAVSSEMAKPSSGPRPI